MLVEIAGEYEADFVTYSCKKTFLAIIYDDKEFNPLVHIKILSILLSCPTRDKYILISDR